MNVWKHCRQETFKIKTATSTKLTSQLPGYAAGGQGPTVLWIDMSVKCGASEVMHFLFPMAMLLSSAGMDQSPSIGFVLLDLSKHGGGNLFFLPSLVTAGQTLTHLSALFPVTRLPSTLGPMCLRLGCWDPRRRTSTLPEANTDS